MDHRRRQAIRGRIRSKVVGGFLDHESALKLAQEEVADEATAGEVAALFGEVVAENEASKAAWSPVTDCDRLDAAFDDLNARGIMARHDWWCCGSCGAAAMPEERERVEGLQPEQAVRGYTFYDNQDTDAAAAGDGLYLSYGAVDDGKAAALEIGREVVTTLERHGLRTSWNGSLANRIGIELVWQRRKRPERWTESED
jgi:hypothetical protein